MKGRGGCITKVGRPCFCEQGNEHIWLFSVQSTYVKGVQAVKVHLRYFTPPSPPKLEATIACKSVPIVNCYDLYTL